MSAIRATHLRVVGRCEFGHESRDLHDAICARHWAQLTRSRHQRRSWRQQLAHWWRSYRWIPEALAALLAALWLTGLAVLIVLGALWRHGVIG